MHFLSLIWTWARSINYPNHIWLPMQQQPREDWFLINTKLMQMGRKSSTTSTEQITPLLEVEKSAPKELLSLFWSEKWINNHINNTAKQQHVLTFTCCLTIRAFYTCWARLSAGEKHKRAKKTLSQCDFSASAEPLLCEIVMIQNTSRVVSSTMSLFPSKFPTRCGFQVDFE